MTAEEIAALTPEEHERRRLKRRAALRESQEREDAAAIAVSKAPRESKPAALRALADAIEHRDRVLRDAWVAGRRGEP